MSIQINVGTGRVEGIDEIRNRLGDSGTIRRNVTPVLRQAARVGVQSARIYAPRGATKRLVGAIEDDAVAFRVRGDQVNVRFGVNPILGNNRGSPLYPVFVHEGTGLYGRLRRVITPRRARHMVFVGRTGLVFAESVRGQRAQPYMAEAYEDARAYVEMHLNEMLHRLVG